MESGDQFFHNFESFNKKNKYNHDNSLTATSNEQLYVEDLVDIHHEVARKKERLELDRHSHSEFLLKALSNVNKSYESLDASRPWMCYWIVHALNILGVDIPAEKKTSVVQFLKSCEDEEGGYGGGPGQFAHLATTYAAVMCLVSLKTNDALNSINIPKLKSFLKRMKQPDGSFAVHVGGEADIRGAYTAIAVASICNILTPELIDRTPEWILRCQTYEGGFGGEPTVEAHGGYTFCAVAAMALLDKFNMIHTQHLIKWLVNRQTGFEGGFNGRVNKLVDGCYSFWQAAAIVIVAEEFTKNGDLIPDGWLFNPKMLQEYILVACQDNRGGLRDKPDKRSDYYHTCYVLSGLSLAQGMDLNVVGEPSNKVNNICSLFNVTTDALQNAHTYFVTRVE